MHQHKSNLPRDEQLGQDYDACLFSAVHIAAIEHRYPSSSYTRVMRVLHTECQAIATELMREFPGAAVTARVQKSLAADWVAGFFMVAPSARAMARARM